MDDECLFCPKPEQLTTWYHEDDTCIVLDNITGGYLVVLKRHTTNPTDEEYELMSRVVTDLFGDHELFVSLAHVKHHWHGHIKEYDTVPV
jgi:hypothetical protein